jgi:hypothetical protein
MRPRRPRSSSARPVTSGAAQASSAAGAVQAAPTMTPPRPARCTSTGSDARAPGRGYPPNMPRTTFRGLCGALQGDAGCAARRVAAMDHDPDPSRATWRAPTAVQARPAVSALSQPGGSSSWQMAPTGTVMERCHDEAFSVQATAMGPAGVAREHVTAPTSGSSSGAQRKTRHPGSRGRSPASPW